MIQRPHLKIEFRLFSARYAQPAKQNEILVHKIIYVNGLGNSRSQKLRDWDPNFLLLWESFQLNIDNKAQNF